MLWGFMIQTTEWPPLNWDERVPFSNAEYRTVGEITRPLGFC